VDDRDRWERLLAETASEHSSACQRICELCVRTLDVTGGGISVVTATGNRGVVCATDDISARIEDLQFTLGEGPCVDAVASGGPVLISDLTESADIAVERWPAFLEGAGAAGVRAVFALPMRIGAISVGVMDLYRETPGDLSADDLSAALHAADAAALALIHLDTELDDTFSDDLGARSTYQLQVHQATGMVQMQAEVRTEEAFLLLRARAFSTGRPLVDIATDVVERRLRFLKEEL
jgi:GAF domain-containing protein